ncbi:hypothetical protein BH24ACI2_BH24ACI2_14910 [soil metagenome]|jgi:hypothetical protein|nr:hypothetical protein [Acidobacteriota bacterium]
MTDFENKKQDNKINSTTDRTQNVSQSGKTGSQTAQPDSELANKVGNIVRGDTEAAKDIYKQAKESTSEAASKAYGTATKKAASKIDEEKINLAQSLSSVADNIRQMGDNLRGAEQTHGVAEVTANYSNTVADKVEQFSGYLEKKDLGELMSDVEDFAQRNPALFLGGAFALGILAARFLRSGNPNQALMRRPRYEREDRFLPKQNRGIHLPENFDEKMKPERNQTDLNTEATGTDTKTSASFASPNKGV